MGSSLCLSKGHLFKHFGMLHGFLDDICFHISTGSNFDLVVCIDLPQKVYNSIFNSQALGRIENKFDLPVMPRRSRFQKTVNFVTVPFNF